MNEIASHVAELVRKLAPAAGAPAPGEGLGEFLSMGFYELGLDSLQNMELVMAIEDRFGIELDEEEIVAARTVGALVALAERLANKPQ